MIEVEEFYFVKRVVSDTYKEIIDKVYAAEQGHVLRFWPELNDSERAQLARQLNEIDFDLHCRLRRKYILSNNPGQVPHDLEPAEFIPLPKNRAGRDAWNNARTVGVRALRDGRVAAFLVAGGQGSRLGYDGPKGKFEVTPVKKKSLFQLQAEKIRALSKRHRIVIPWYIMTSETNHNETVSYFEDNDYFGLGRENVILFPQAMVPALDANGRLFLETKSTIFRNPNGHGGSLAALNSSGALDDMKRRGIEYVFYFQVDNVLINICDPVFLGFHIQGEADMSAKIVEKSDPEEKVGVIGRIEGRLGVIEYSDLPHELKYAQNDDGTLRFRAGSIAIHIFNVAFVEQENQGGFHLPWHLAKKQIPFVDENGNTVTPDEPNGYKFETFVFDALNDAKRAVFLEVDRAEEFSPVKNAEGVDSPATAETHMIAQFARWLTAAGIPYPKSTKVEISPLFALDEEEFVAKVDRNLKVGNELYIGA